MEKKNKTFSKKKKKLNKMLWQSYKWLSSSTTVVQILPTIWDSYQNNASCRTDKNKE